MRRIIVQVLTVVTVGLVFCLFGQDIRPVRDDVGYCWDSRQLGRLMDYLKSVDKGAVKIPRLVAGISPHDDYLYAGNVYYSLFKQIPRTAKEVVIFAVTHGTVRKKIGDPQNILIFDSYPSWKGPYQEVKISKLRGYLKENLDSHLYITNNEAHELEHSIEAMIPFLQFFNRDIQVTPIMVTGMNFETMGKLSAVLSSLLVSYIKENNLEIGKDIVFLISADANHYGKDFDNAVYGEDQRAHELGTKRDREIAGTFLAGKMDREKIKELTGELWGKTYLDYKDTVWCGKYSIPLGMLTVIQVVERLQGGKELAGEIIRYSDTYTEGVIPLKNPGFGITAPFSFKHWVGFFSAGYYLK